MCGICGIIRFDREKIEESNILSMMNAIRHRGPDDQGFNIADNFGLGFVRLSIIDLSKEANQPMKSIDNRCIIVYNGEIYNYLELKEELNVKYNFKTQTDTEVVINAYLEWGEKCLDYLNGMFAFVIYDFQKEEFFIARDRFGMKPFYYYQDEKCFVFGSEIPAILAVLKEKPEADDQIIYDYLVHNRTNHTERTFFKNIYKLQHGHFIKIRNNQIEFSKWYDLEKNIDANKRYSSEELKSLLIDAVGIHLRSDVPVGTCLSGGIDSSAIVSIILDSYKNSNLNTFSAVYDTLDCADESKYINEYSSLIRNMKFCKPSCQNFIDDMDRFIEALQEPIPNTSEYAEFKVFELVGKYNKVVLNGQGSDEEFAGYIYSLGLYYKELLKKFSLIKIIRELYGDVSNHHNFEGFKYLFYFLLPGFIKDRVGKSKVNYLDEGFLTGYTGDPSYLKKLYGAGGLHKALINHFEYKFEHHLLWGDRSSMYFSVESRYPFLDHRLVEMALSLKSGQLIRNGNTKYILREALKGLIPENIRTRQNKVGYETPESRWFKEPVITERFKEIIQSQSFRQRKYFNPVKVDKLLDRHINNQAENAQEIWKCINLELWLRKFIDN